MSSFQQLAARIRRIKSLTPIRAQSMFTLQQTQEIGRERNDLMKVAIRPRLEDYLALYDYHLPSVLQQYNIQETFTISLKIQISLITAEVAAAQTTQSSSYHLLKEFFVEFLGTQAINLEGSALSTFNECVTTIKPYLTPESFSTSAESYQTTLHLVGLFKYNKIITVPVTADCANTEIQTTILEQFRKLNQEPFSVQLAWFHVYLRACLRYHFMRSDLVRLVFTFGMSFSRREQMSDVAWTPRWEALEDRYPGDAQCIFLWKMLRVYLALS
jgi:hypothetical protein